MERSRKGRRHWSREWALRRTVRGGKKRRMNEMNETKEMNEAQSVSVFCIQLYQ